MQIATGTYTGTGIERSITGVGFLPDFVLIQGEGELACAKTRKIQDNDPNGTAKLGSAAWFFLNGIKTLDADGFTVVTANEVNANGTEYYYICFRDNGGGDFIEDVYYGTGADDLQITGFGFQPDVVMIFPRYDGTTQASWKCDQMAGEESHGFAATSYATDNIQDLLADGFEVGTHKNVNIDTRDYYYVAWKKVNGQCSTGFYEGDGLNDRAITGTGFTPRWILQLETSGIGFAVHRMDSMVAEESWLVIGTAEGKAVWGFGADEFTVNAVGNHSNSAIFDYYWVGWSDEATPVEAAMEYYRRRRIA